MILNLGCGSRPTSGAVNVDIADIPGVDVVMDLDVHPWLLRGHPAAPDGFDRIEAIDIFEHVSDAVAFMVACHETLTIGGILHIHTPYYKSIDAFTDPTHKRFPTEHTFDYWIPQTTLHKAHNAAYGGVSFEGIRLFLDQDGALDVTLRKI